jgi:hypothetical protein
MSLKKRVALKRIVKCAKEPELYRFQIITPSLGNQKTYDVNDAPHTAQRSDLNGTDGISDIRLHP